MTILRRSFLVGLAATAGCPVLISPAQARVIGGVKVTNLRSPTCAITNGVPRVPRGTYYSKVVGDQPALGLTDPWNSFPSITGTYSALVMNGLEPAAAVYKYKAVRRTLTFIWGSPDEGNRLQFKNGDATVAMLSGNEIAGVFGWADGLNLRFETPAPFDVVKLFSTDLLVFEWANWNSDC